MIDGKVNDKNGKWSKKEERKLTRKGWKGNG